MLKQDLTLQILKCPLKCPFRPLSKGKNKGVIGLTKDKLGGQIMKEIVGLKAKIYSYLKDNSGEQNVS